jgi:hypothetical protein
VQREDKKKKNNNERESLELEKGRNQDRMKV